MINFNQNAWLKSYIGMNKDIRKDAKKNFEKRLFKLMNNSFFRKTLKNVHKRKKKKLFGFIFLIETDDTYKDI